MSSEINTSIFYCLAIADDDPHETSPFQGFSPGLMTLSWAMRRLIHLPADVVEPALPYEAVLARRMGGTGGWRWFPLSLRALSEISIDATAPFWVVFSGTLTVAEAVSAWAEKQSIRPLHVTAGPYENATTSDSLNEEVIRKHVERTLHFVRTRHSELDSVFAEECCESWQDRRHTDAQFPKRTHNCTLPNHMVLEGAGVSFENAVPLVGNSIEIYVDAIRETTAAVRRLRHSVGDVPGFRLTPPQPALLLTAPALYRHVYADKLTLTHDDDSDEKVLKRMIRYMQRQRTFHWSVSKKDHESFFSSEKALSVMLLRQEELEVQTLAVGLRGASTIAATLRVPPAVNRTAGVVRQIATHERNRRIYRPEKLARLFLAVQKALTEAVGSRLVKVIKETTGGVKLVTDAPMEWLPIDGLPLGLRFECSRITATPGNLMVGELVAPALLRLSTNAFSDVLVISAFDIRDPIRNILRRTLDIIEPKWRNRINVRFVTVQTQAEFCNALDNYDGCILIFDGHGNHSDETGEGTLRIGNNAVNVWSLRGRTRIPPIVILSACDTQAAERSHVTTANGFLAAGARAVLGTLLPINAAGAGLFVGRLLYRLSEFLPTALEVRGEAVQWSEVISGMQRMQLVTDLLRPYLADKLITEESYEHIHTQGNVAINNRRTDWFEHVGILTAEHLCCSVEQVQDDFQKRIAVSDTVRYVHMGNPESILIDSSATMTSVLSDLVDPGLGGTINAVEDL